MDYFYMLQVLYDLKALAEKQENSRFTDCMIYAIDELKKIAGDYEDA